MRPNSLIAAAACAVSLCACSSSTRPDAAPASAALAILPAPTDTAPASALITTREPWTFRGQPGAILSTSHFRLFTTQAEAPSTMQALTALEAALPVYRSLGSTPEPKKPLDLYLFSTRGQWEAFTRQLLAENAGPFLAIPRGGYTWSARTVLYNLGGPRRHLTALAAHEGWHLYTQSTFAQPLPTWAEEGLATLMEGHRTLEPGLTFLPWCNTDRFDDLRQAVRQGELASLRRLLTESPAALLDSRAEAPLRYYGQCWALMHFLREGDEGRHAQALKDMIADAAAGRMAAHVVAKLGSPRAASLLPQARGLAVFEAYFGADLDGLDAQFAQFVARVCRPDARARVILGQSPAAD